MPHKGKMKDYSSKMKFSSNLSACVVLIVITRHCVTVLSHAVPAHKYTFRELMLEKEIKI